MHSELPPAPGLERLPLRDLRSARVGLVAHPASRTRSGAHAADVLAALPSLRLTALFGPEHGFFGRAAAGAPVPDASSPLGLPIHSLYGPTRAPLPEWLAPLDALLFDLQSLACRPYTYGSTLLLAMRACADARIPLYVLDRPDPLMLLPPDGPFPLSPWTSFVGLLPTPFLHGLTLGELALHLQRALPLPALELHVVSSENLSRDALRRSSLASAFPPSAWVPPSPAIRALSNALIYPMTVFAEAFPALDVARDTPDAFQVLRFPPHDLRPLASPLTASIPGLLATPAPPDALRFAVVSPSDFRAATAARTLLSLIEAHTSTPLLSTPSARPEWLNKLWATPCPPRAVSPSAPSAPFSPRLLY